MTFYLRPPEGTVPAQLYQLYAESRLKLLIACNQKPEIRLENLLEQNALEIARLDAIIPDTIHDRISHFALRSFVLLDPILSDSIQKWEENLFHRRIQCSGNEKQVDINVRSLLRQLRHFIPFLSTIPTSSSVDALKLKQNARFLKATSLALIHLVKARYTLCQRTKDTTICPKHGNVKFLSVPFTQVLPLVAKLEVNLVQGKAQLYCHQIPAYLKHIFSKLLSISTDLMKANECWAKIQSDSRLIEGCEELRKILKTYGYLFALSYEIPTSNSRSTEFNSELVQYFPPCMRNMYKTLRHTHRLPHHSRVQFVLFLKSISVSVDSTLQLFSEEYSKPPMPLKDGEASHKCEHSWQKDSSRYIYSTRHLYGLEGSRKNYSSHTCSAIQNSTPFSGCGGCPFVLPVSKQLETLGEDLDGQSDEEKQLIEKIQQTENGNSSITTPIETCHEYLWLKIRKLKGTNLWPSESSPNSCYKNRTNSHKILTFKPAHFYRSIKNLVDE